MKNSLRVILLFSFSAFTIFLNHHILFEFFLIADIDIISEPQEENFLVIDAFPFNGEEIVSARLELLHEVVDYFYITESVYSFSGKVKNQLYRDKNAHVFKPHEEKIIWLTLNAFPHSHNTPWKREEYQRNYAATFIKNDLKNTQFVVINTDCDEIPDPLIVREFRPGKKLHSLVTGEIHCLCLEMFYYNFNWRKGYFWKVGSVIPGNVILNSTHSLQTIREKSAKFPPILNAGWHGSYFMSVENIIRKIDSFSHQEYNSDKYKNKKHIENCIKSGKDLFNRKGKDMKYFDHTQLPLPLQKFHSYLCNIQNVL